MAEVSHGSVHWGTVTQIFVKLKSIDELLFFFLEREISLTLISLRVGSYTLINFTKVIKVFTL